MKHTKEPWRIDDERDTYTKGLHICGDADDETNGCGIAGIWIDGELDHDTQHENARRIVSCVNACAGSTNEELKLIEENGGIDVAAIMRWDNVRNLVKERDDLQARLDRLLVSVDAASNWIRNCSTPLDAARELELAAAKARG